MKHLINNYLLPQNFFKTSLTTVQPVSEEDQPDQPYNRTMQPKSDEWGSGQSSETTSPSNEVAMTSIANSEGKAGSMVLIVSNEILDDFVYIFKEKNTTLLYIKETKLVIPFFVMKIYN